MPVRNYSSTAVETTLSAGVSDAATVLTVGSTAGFPAAPFILAIDAGAAAQELVLVTNVAGTNLTVTRGYDSTIASAHEAGAKVQHSHAALDFREANAHANATSGVHGANGPVVGDDDMAAYVTAAVNDALLAANPIGSIEFNTTNTNPSTYLGGTWVPWGSGRVPVGVDGSQTEFNTVEKTGGAKTHTLTAGEVPSHTHPLSVKNAATEAGGYGLGASGTFTDRVIVTGASGDTTTGATGGGGAHNNLQPYITCYMFKRTA